MRFFLAALLLLLGACSSLFGPSSDVPSAERSPTDLSGGNASAPPPTGGALVDVLASSFELDKTSATADGIDAITLSISLRTPTSTPAADVTISVMLDGVSNAVDPALVVSNAEGNATVTLRSTRAQDKKLTIRVQQGLLGARTVTFVPGPVDEVRSSLIATPNHQRASGADSIVLTVQLRDAAGNPVGLEPVGLVISGTGNTVSVAGSPFSSSLMNGVTNAAGDLVVQLRSTTAESKRIVAMAQNRYVRGLARFVDEWFLAAGAPYGDRFDCVAVEGTAGDRTWYAHTLHGTFASEGGEFAHVRAPRVAAECRSLAVDGGQLYAAFADDRARKLEAGAWVDLGDPQTDMQALFVDKRQTPAKLWLATSSNIFVLNASAWQAAGVSGPTGAHDFVVDESTLFVATQKGVYSRDVVASSWTFLDGLSEDTLALAVAVEGSTRTLYAATATSSVWRYTIGAGGAWQQVSAGLPNLPCSAIAIDSSSTPARLFVTTEELVGSPIAVHRSLLYSKLTDAATWTLVAAQPAGEGERLHNLFIADGVHAAVQKRGILRLDATLRSVTPLGAALPGYGVRSIVHDVSRDRLFALTVKGVYRSDDFGEHWRLLSLGEGETPVSVSVDSDRSPSRLLVSSDGLTTSHLFESQDGGDTFTDVTGTLAAQTTVGISSAAYAYTSRTLFVSDSTQLLQRTLAPSTYAEVDLLTPPFPGPSTNILRLDALDDVLYLDTDAGVFARVGGGAQSRIGGSSFTRAVRQTTKAQDGALWFATDLGLFRLPLATADAERVDEGGATAGLSFASVISDPMRAIVFALSDAAVFRIDSDLEPKVETFTPAAAPRALSVVTKLGGNAPPLVLVGCDEAAGLYASIYE